MPRKTSQPPQDPFTTVQTAQYLDAAMRDAGTFLRHREPPRAMLLPQARMGGFFLVLLHLVCVIWGYEWFGRVAPIGAVPVTATVASERDGVLTVYATWEGQTDSGQVPLDSLEETPAIGSQIPLLLDPGSRSHGVAAFYAPTASAALRRETTLLAVTWVLLLVLDALRIIRRRQRRDQER